MKRTTLIICLLTMAMMACKPDPQPGPDPNIGGQPEDTTGTVVKKYLVKEYLEGSVDEPIMMIDWNEDFSRIIRIITYKNTPYQINYDFEYFGADSMHVVMSVPEVSWALVRFSRYTCHFDNEQRITHIDYYYNAHYKNTEYYCYDDNNGKLISITYKEYKVGVRFEWSGDNVIACYFIPSGEKQFSFEGFFDCIHPYYTLPYLLPDGDSYHFWHLTEPLWRNWYNYSEDLLFDFDEDNYVTCAYRINEEGERYAIKHYEYAN